MTTHYTSRPLLASDAPHVARIDAMQSENPMGAEQIRKMVSRQHIGGLVVENSEGVIVAWCMHLRCHGVLDVVRFQGHIEFDALLPFEVMTDYLISKPCDRVVVSVSRQNYRIANKLEQCGFKCNQADSNGLPVVVMEYLGDKPF
jgi:hypothetical protein